MCNGKVAMVPQKKNKKQNTKHQEGLLLTFSSNKSVPSFNYASAYPIGNEKMFPHRSGSSLRLQRTVIWLATQLHEFRSKQAKRANIHYLYISSIASHFLFDYKVFGSQTEHTNNTSLVQRILRKRATSQR